MEDAEGYPEDYGGTRLQQRWQPFQSSYCYCTLPEDSQHYEIVSVCSYRHCSRCYFWYLRDVLSAGVADSQDG